MNPPKKIKTSAGYETVDETVARAKAQVAPAPTKDRAITPEALEPTPQMKFVEPAPAVVAPSLRAQLEATNDDFTAQLTQKRQEAEGTKNTALASYLEALKKTQGQTQLEAKEFARPGGVNDITLELNDINDQIRREQLGLRRAQENVMDLGGQSKGQAQSQLNNIQRESLRKQADLSVIQMAIQGRYDSAREIADRAVKARLEQQQIYNEALKFNYEENKDLFTQAEQREFETLLRNRERAYQLKYEDYKAVSDTALEVLRNGGSPALAARVQQANSREEAMALGGQYVGLLDRRVAEANIAQSYASVANSYDQIAKRAEEAKARLGTLNGKDQTQTEKQIQGYANRLVEGNNIIQQLGGQFTKPTALIGQMAPNIFKSGDRQKFEQAQRNFINAVLRRESGAVISPEEFNNARQQYFPQPGDSAGVLAQKAVNRNTVISNFYNEANIPMPEFNQQQGATGVTSSGISYTILP